MKTVFLLTQVLIIALLGFISYNTGTGKTFPVHHPDWMSCSGLLTRNLFNSTLLEQGDNTKDVAGKVRDASSFDEISQLVSDGSNINASRTQWFESVSENGKCQAQVFLQTPNKDGNNTAYIAFDIGGFVPPNQGITESLTATHVLQTIHLEMLGTKWFKE